MECTPYLLALAYHIFIHAYPVSVFEHAHLVVPWCWTFSTTWWVISGGNGTSLTSLTQLNAEIVDSDAIVMIFLDIFFVIFSRSDEIRYSGFFPQGFEKRNGSRRRQILAAARNEDRSKAVFSVDVIILFSKAAENNLSRSYNERFTIRTLS